MPLLSSSSLLKGLRSSPKQIPFSFLYDAVGSQLYERITQLKEYYPFSTEAAMLEEHSSAIASHIPQDSVVVELGCGTAEKTAMLLSAVIARHGACKYAGIDVSASFLEGAKANLLSTCDGLRPTDIDLVCAEYIPGLREVRRSHPCANLCILWLGSSVGNLAPTEAVGFFKALEEAAGPRSQLFLCADMWKDRSVLHRAYCDSQGVTEAFIKNGVRNALVSLGHDSAPLAAEMDTWKYEVEVNPKERRVEMWVRFPQGLDIVPGSNGSAIRVDCGERILMEVSRKFTPGDIARLTAASGFCIHATWRTQVYGMYMVLPMEEALRRCWAETDDFFNKVSDWSRKPIDMRHPFCFYYGHCASFTRLKVLPDVPASNLDDMFSRGIDPIVLDPTKCHSHPDVPPEWPTRKQIVAYVQKARNIVLDALRSGTASLRAVLIGLEHEFMHQETLAYMLAQEKRKLFEAAPPKALPEAAAAAADSPSQHPPVGPDVKILPGKVVLGLEPEDAGGFVWDNELPALHTAVAAPFTVSTHPVTIAQYHSFVVEHKGYERSEYWAPTDWAFLRKEGITMPATWSVLGGEIYVHLPDGTFHWSKVASRPVWSSMTEAEAYCKSVGCRLMTEVEYHRALDDVDAGKAEVASLREGGWEWTSTPFGPFPGFQAMDEYPEYSTDFFTGCHFVLKGSSPLTHPSMQRDSFRNYYQRQYPYVFAKFRCCK